MDFGDWLGDTGTPLTAAMAMLLYADDILLIPWTLTGRQQYTKACKAS